MHPLLIIPGLFPEIPDPDVPRLPGLERWLAQGDLQWTPGNWMLETCLAYCHRVPEARLRAERSGLRERHPHWLCADPIHLQVETDSLILVENLALELNQSEADSAIAALNRHFAPDGLSFYAPSPNQWLVGLQNPAELITAHPLSRAGRNIDGHLPSGPHGRLWRSRFNEAQMVLHDHAINRARESRHARTVSGVWFWDALPQAAAGPMAGLLGGPAPRLPAEMEIVEALRVASAYGDAEGWREAATRLERERIVPLLKELDAGRISGLTLVALEGRVAAVSQLSPAHRWRFWRRPRPIMQWPQVPALNHR